MKIVLQHSIQISIVNIHGDGMGETKSYTAYHGTGKECIPKIHRYGFKITNTGYLGKGIYFFENNFNLALKWAQKDKPHYKEHCVLSALITVDEDKVLDIADPSNLERIEILDGLKNQIRRIIQKRNQLPNNPKFYEGLIINDMCIARGKVLVRASTITDTDELVDGIRIIHGIANGVELCVKDEKLIKLQ